MSTIVFTEKVIDLVAINADWNWYDTLPAYATSLAGVPIHSIQFHPSTKDDHCVIKQGGATGAEIGRASCRERV